MLIKYMQQEIELRNYSMLLGVSNDLIVQERRIVDFFMSRNIEGLIVVPANAEESRLDHLYALNQQEIPFVYCTGYYKGLSADCVMTDLQKGSYLLTRHLINSGHKKIILISGRPDAALSFLRVNGYKQAYQEAGIPYDSSWIKETNTDYQSGYAAAEQIIAQGLPDAIITINDMLAIGVLKCCKDKGIKVPGDVSVAGYDDLLFSAVAETPLTTVRQPIELICKKSVERIIDRIEKKNTPLDAVLLEPELILRESVRS